MTEFALYAALILAVVLALVLPALWFGAAAGKPKANRQESNLAILRDQLADLEREHAEGTLSEADFSLAKSELQRRLLDEIEPPAASAEAVVATSSRKVAIALLITLPILAVTGYALIGNPKAIDPQARVAKPQMTPEQINAMVDRLAAKLQANPEDMQGWLMLARSYKSLGRYEEALKAYAKAEKVIAQEPDLLASYAETLAMVNGKGLQGKPRQLAEQALKIDPKHPHSLFLAGAAAMEAGDNKRGIAHWEALLPAVEPGSDIEKMLQDGIAQMKAGK